MPAWCEQATLQKRVSVTMASLSVCQLTCALNKQKAIVTQRQVGTFQLYHVMYTITLYHLMYHLSSLGRQPVAKTSSAPDIKNAHQGAGNKQHAATG